MARIPTAVKLLAAARATLDDADDFEVAVALRQRYGLRTSQSVVNRWQRGETAPNYEATYALMEMAGWLNRDRTAAGDADALEQAREAAKEGEATIRALAEREQSPPARRRRSGAA